MIEVKDRVPTYPGRVIMTPVSGQSNVYDMVRADQPTEPGTPINRKLFEDIQNDLNYKIGDLKVSMRTDLGEKWLLCNGDPIDAADYPELSQICPQTVENMTNEFQNLWEGNTGDTKITGIAYGNGYWVACGRYYNNVNYTYGARIAYATSLNGPWTTVDLWDTLNCYLNCITFANGYFVVGGESEDYARIAYATNPAATWTIKDLWDGTNAMVNCITYANGYWVAGGGENYGTAYMAYTTDLAGTWTERIAWTGSNNDAEVKSITYANGYWVAGGYYYYSSYYARISYATSLDGTWTEKNIWSSSSGYHAINSIAYANGYWVVGGQYYPTGTYSARIAYATSLDGSWTTKDLWQGEDSDVKSVTFAGGYWVAGGCGYWSSTGYGRIAYSTTPDGEWTNKDLWSNNNANENIVFAAAYINSRWIFAGTYESDGLYYARIANSTDGGILPVIAGPAYTYIKALEG